MTDQSTDQPTDQTPLVFTATVEAQYADAMRDKRDRTDAEMAADFPVRPAQGTIARKRASETSSRRNWQRIAIEQAVASVISQATDASYTYFDHPDYDDETTSIPTLDLDDVTITVTLTDLVATATLTLPVAR